MSSINYNEFQAGQGVSAPALNENFALTNSAIENMEVLVNSAMSSLTSTTSLKANKNGSVTEKFSVADATSDNHAVSLSQMNNAIAPLSPVGSVIWFAGSSVPTGYLLCDGRAVSRSTYSVLFGIIGVKYGVGNGSSTFNLPNLINRFIQGANSAGTYKSAGLPNITGSFCGSTEGTWSGAFTKGSNVGRKTEGSDWQYSVQGTFRASDSNSIYGASSTVQPPALTLLPCIRY